MLDGLLAIIAPHSCCGCGKLGAIVCESCKNDIVFEPFTQCIKCLQPTVTSNLCSSCGTRLGIDAAWCVGLRDGMLRNLLARYKFDSAQEAGAVCADLVDTVIPVLPSTTTVVPVPTAPGHRRVRGFDHMERVTKPLAKRRHLPHQNMLVRYDNTTQHFKSKTERLKTAAHGLEVRGDIPNTVLLVDDIYTTGATVRACVSKLRKAGVQHVLVAIIARQTIEDNQ